MAYIGKTPTIGNFQVCDAISVVNGQAAYTMQVGSVNVSPESANHMLVSLNGILQKPGSSYTVSGSTITFASNLVTGDVIDFIQILGNVLDLGVPSDATVSLAKLTATGTKDATTFLRGDNTFASPTDNGRFTLVSTATIGGGATYIDMDDVFSATYKNYLLVFTSVNPATDNVQFHIQVKTASGVVSGGSDYVYGITQPRSNGATTNAYSTGASFYRLNDYGTGNATAESGSGTVMFYDPRSTTFYHTMICNMTSLSNGVDALGNFSAGTAKTTTALTGLRFKTSSGNLDSGVLKLYGAND